MAIKRNTYVDFREEAPLHLFNPATGITAVVTTATKSAFRTSSGEYFEFYQDGQNDQTVLTGGAIGANGWVPPIDDDADSIEITRGVTSANAKNKFTVGTDPAFFLRVGGKVGTIARSTCMLFGFRKLAAYATTAANMATAITAYTDAAFIGTDDVAGVVTTKTSNDNSDVTTDLAHAAIADSTWFSYEINVSAAGVVTYRLGTSTASFAAAEAALAADASAVAFSFDDAEVLVPCMIWLGTNATGINDSSILKYECGLAA